MKPMYEADAIPEINYISMNTVGSMVKKRIWILLNVNLFSAIRIEVDAMLRDPICSVTEKYQ